MYLHVCINACICMCLSTHVCACVYQRMYMYVCINACMCMCVSTACQRACQLHVIRPNPRMTHAYADFTMCKVSTHVYRYACTCRFHNVYVSTHVCACEHTCNAQYAKVLVKRARALSLALARSLSRSHSLSRMYAPICRLYNRP